MVLSGSLMSTATATPTCAGGYYGITCVLGSGTYFFNPTVSQRLIAAWVLDHIAVNLHFIFFSLSIAVI
jgi:hypothetical protein